MQINKTTNISFNGRVNLPGEKFFTKMINGMDYFEKRNAEARLYSKDSAKEEDKVKPFLSRVKEFFFPEKPKVFIAPKTYLKDYWMKTIKEMAKLATEKLPDEYVLRCRKSNLGKEYLSFSITKGKEHVYGVTANINDPKFPEEQLQQAIEKISTSLKEYL